MPTLQDVAKRAGVSIATVSKVLSNTPYFTDETREKVMRAVKELGYTPHLAARALSSGKTRIVGVAFPYIYDAIFKDPLAMQILEGIEAACSAGGYNLLLSAPRLTTEGPDEQYQQLVRSGYIDGMIAIDNVPLASVAKVAAERGIPTVVIGYAPAQFSVRGDDFAGGQMLADHLLALGHRSFGVITVPDAMNYAIEARMKGVRDRLARSDIALTDEQIAYGDFSSAGGASAVLSLIERLPALTAIICLNDRMAIGAMQALKQRGYRVPQDISVVGYDNIGLSALFTPRLTTIDQKASALGYTATQLLFDILNGQVPAPVVMPVELLIRDSSGAYQPVVFDDAITD